MSSFHFREMIYVFTRLTLTDIYIYIYTHQYAYMHIDEIRFPEGIHQKQHHQPWISWRLVLLSRFCPGHRVHQVQTFIGSWRMHSSNCTKTGGARGAGFYCISVKRIRPIRPGPRGDQFYFFHINGSFAASEVILLASEYHITSLLGLYTVQWYSFPMMFPWIFP